MLRKNKEHYTEERERSDSNFFFFTLINGDVEIAFEIFDKEMGLASEKEVRVGNRLFSVEWPLILFPSTFITYTIPKGNNYIIC